jgi:hypothetical protein
LSINGHDVILDLLNSLVKFRSTIVRLYYWKEDVSNIDENGNRNKTEDGTNVILDKLEWCEIEDVYLEVSPDIYLEVVLDEPKQLWWWQGCPLGSKNKPNVYMVVAFII